MSSVRSNLKGNRYGRLLAIKATRMSSGRTGWVCECDCGVRKSVGTRELAYGVTKSCGCLNSEHQKEFVRINTRHGKRYSREYCAWRHMKGRCFNPRNKFYPEYGGRGITVCERWMKFENFYADMGDKPYGTTIDRFPDNDGNYEPGNCRWATDAQQSRNKRNNIWVNLNGNRIILKDACLLLELPYHSVTARIRNGRSPEKAITTPIRKGNYK